MLSVFFLQESLCVSLQLNCSCNTKKKEKENVKQRKRNKGAFVGRGWVAQFRERRGNVSWSLVAPLVPTYH